MKRHHIAAVFALIGGGLFTYIRLRDGDTEGAIWTGIIFALLGISDLCPTRNFRVLLRKISTPAQTRGNRI